MTEQTARLLRDAENYLSALHGSVARHDNLAANFGCAGCELRDKLAAELRAVSSAGPAPATDPATLRQRIADTVRELHDTGAVYALDAGEPERIADAVLSVLPASADRAAVLLWAADIAESLRQFERCTGPRRAAQTSENVGVLRVADELRRLAGEAQQDPTQDGTSPTAYSDGMGRVFCVACPRPDSANVPLTVEYVDHWDLCPSCGRHVVDVARAAKQPAAVARPGQKETEA